MTTLVLTPGSVIALVDGTVVIEASGPIDRCPAEFWETVREASGGRATLRIALSPPDIYAVRLPGQIDDVRSALSVHAPMTIDRLVWGAPQDDGATARLVTIARKDRIAQIAAILSTHDLPPPEFVDANGFAIDRQVGAQRNRQRITLAIVLAALLSIPASTAIGAWTMRQAIEPTARARTQVTRDATFVALADDPTVTATLVDMAGSVPEDASLVAVSRGDDGRVALEIDAPDPDRLREQIRGVSALQGFREQSQMRGPDARYRVTLVGMPR